MPSVFRMYTRIIQNAPERIVRSGKPIFGDFCDVPLFFDIRKLKQPFSIMPLPSFISNLRIRTNLCFSFLADNYAGTMEIMDAGWFGFAEVNIWEKDTARKLSFRSFILFRKRLIPLTLKNGLCKSLRKKRIFIIRWDYESGHFSVRCRFKGDRMRPNTFFEFSGNINDSVCGRHTSVIPAPLMRRCSAVHHCAPILKAKMSGGFFSEDKKTPFECKEAPGFFSVRRSYYKLRTGCYSLTLIGAVDGRNIRCNLYTSNQDPVDSDLYNENILFADGESTALPPVTITHPYGLLERWIIQDTESMIDLSFTPRFDTVRKESILILRTEYHTIYGECEGVIRDKKGESFILKNFCAIAKKQYLRL